MNETHSVSCWRYRAPHLVPLLVLSWFFPLASAAGQSADLLQLAVHGHRQACESIRSIHVRIRTDSITVDKSGKSDRTTIHGEWWQSGQSYRWQEHSARRGPLMTKDGAPTGGSRGQKATIVTQDAVTDGCVVDGLMTFVSKVTQPGGLSRSSAAIGLADGHEASAWNPTNRVALVLSDNPHVTMLDVLENREWAKEISEVELDGVPCLRIKCPGSGERSPLQAWLSMRHGFLVKCAS